MGPAGHQVSLEGGHRIFSFRGSFWSTASPARPVPHITRTAVAFIPQGPAGDPQQQDTTAGEPQQPPWSAHAARRAAPHQVRPGSPQWSTAAAFSHVRRSIPGSGEISTFFQNSGGSQARHRVNSSPETMHVAAGCAACRPTLPRPTPDGSSRRHSSS
jgi:hypothetical protein